MRRRVVIALILILGTAGGRWLHSIDYPEGLMPATTTRVFVTTRFEGFHRWPDAPDEVAFLRDRHRHVFHVRAEKLVSHGDRDVEFILLKRSVEAEIAKVSAEQETETWSCERWAEELLRRLQLDRVEVSEDRENGAIVERRP